MARTIADQGVPYYPAFLDLRRKRVVVVGGGAIATGKVRGLLPCGPDPLVVIAPRASPAIREAARAGRVEWRARPYEDGDLAGADLVIAATDDRALNARVAAEARRRGVLVLAVDDAPNCDFVAPALVERGDLTIAISTGGRSPAMARWVRERLDASLPGSWSDLLAAASIVRTRLGQERRRIPPERWQAALDQALESLARGGDQDAAVRVLLDVLTARSVSSGDRPSAAPVPARAGRGLVSLVGAGPGDPELLTLRGLHRLRDADAVVHDRLIDRQLLSYCRPTAALYDVGKAPGQHACPQEQINALLVRLAREGRRVVRLKGGDPFVFGRGGEEAMALAEAGVPFEIVPGVSSALAVPAVAGIPVTHRGLASAITIATGHPRHDATGDYDWEALTRLGGTLVFLMAVENLQRIVRQLLAHGRSPNEPAALIQSGTTPEQRVIGAPLAEIATLAAEAGIRPPAVLVVGPTVALASLIQPRPATPRRAAVASTGLTDSLPAEAWSPAS